jgi:NAD(P)-dependent dehydrogenase (short-subunit alcohol dehydrogenase family)
VQHVLANGDYVVATARDPSGLQFKGATDKNLLKARLDVTDKSSITKAFDEAKDKFGRVDVVVNNAGYGLAGCFEEYTEEHVRKQFDVNFFGLVSLSLVWTRMSTAKVLTM